MLSQEEKNNIHQNTWEKLLATKDYLGDEILDESRTKEIDHGQPTGEYIDQALRSILRDEAHIIYPDTFYSTSIFGKIKQNAHHTIIMRRKQIYDMKNVQIRYQKETIEHNLVQTSD